MSKPGIIYRGTIKDTQFTTANALDVKTWLVHILDHGNLINDADSEQFIDMTMAGEPITGLTRNNDEDKFSPILSTTVELLVHTDDSVSINTFAGGDDNRWEVKIWLVNQIWFRGFLKLDDIQQDFMPDPNELLLTASDNLEILNDVPLTDTNGDTIRGYNKIITYIANALKKTGLELEIKVINNIREQDTATFVAADATFVTSPNQIGTTAGPTYFAAGKKIRVSGTVNNNRVFTIISVINSAPTITLNVVETPVTEIATNVIFNDAEGHFYNHEYLEAKTFEGDEVGVSHDCFTVLEKILGEHCRLFQHWGQWWIISVDEIDSYDLKVFTFDADGVLDVNFTTTTYEKEIGIDKSIFFINEDAIVKATIPHKYIKETYDFNYPIEIICNIDFSRGDLIDELVGYKTYVLDDWTHGKITGGLLTFGAASNDTYIRRNEDNFGDETNRFLVLESEGAFASSLKSCEIPVGADDRIIFSIDYNLSADNGVSGSVSFNVAYLALHGADGTYWTMDYGSVGGINGKWFQSNGTFTSNLRAIKDAYDATDVDQTEPRNLSVTSQQIPVDGYLYVILLNSNFNSSASDIHFSNLDFTYKAFINNGYRETRGYYNKITSVNTNNKVKREKEVLVSDPPRRIFKGALHKYNGSDYELTEGFFKWNIYHSTAPPAAQIRKYQEWQAWWVWNQFRLANREFDFAAQGIDSNALISTTPNPISPLHKFLLTDTNESTTGRHFMLLHHEANIHLGEWTGFLSEVYNEAEGKNYGTESTTSTSIIGRWWVMSYNNGGVQTAYFMDVSSVSPSGYYRQNTPSVPPYPATDFLTNYTYVGAGISDLLTYLGITYMDIISFPYSGSDTTLTATTTIITSEHEFKYVLENE